MTTSKNYCVVLIGLFATVLALLGRASAVTAYEAELKAYNKALESICRTGVTAEHIRLYEALVKAVEESQYGRGRDSNFWGPNSPEVAFQRCLAGISVSRHFPAGKVKR